MKNLILIGFMGTGKTSVGKRVAAALNWTFLDTDQEIEEVTGIEIKEIFRRFGEKRFRSEEEAAVKRITKGENQVISTGGGIVLNPLNLQALKECGLVIALTASPEVIYERVSRKNNRPLLLTEQPLTTIRELLSKREPLYAQGHVSINTDNKTIGQVVDEILNTYQQYQK
jgi:shikimate kinase